MLHLATSKALSVQTYLLGLQSTSGASHDEHDQHTTVRSKPPTMADFDEALSIIKTILPEDCISRDREDLISHGSSSWTYHDPKVLPGAVLYPRKTEDVRSASAEELFLSDISFSIQGCWIGKGIYSYLKN